MSKDKQVWDKKKLLKQGDTIKFHVPIVDHGVTINEIHAFQMGTIGLFVGLLYQTHFQDVAVFFSLLMLGYAIIGRPAFRSLEHDHPEYVTMGMKTIRHEPWWFITPYIITFLIGTLF